MKIFIKNALNNNYEDTLEYKISEFIYQFKREIRIGRNEIRLKLANKLLGKELILEIKKTPQGNYVELIDMKRRMTFGRWEATEIKEGKIKLHR